MKKTLSLLAILALGLTACNKVELQDTPEQTPETFTEAPACFFNLSASFGGDEATKAVTIGENTATSSFEAGDKIYVYIERTSNSPAFGYDAGALTPLTIENINGATCDLSGTLKFYYNNGAEAYTPQENDVVHLLYNLNGNLSSPDNPYFAIEKLNGAKDGYVDPTGLGYSSLYTWGANHFDFAEAVMIVTAVSGAADPGYTLTLGKVGDPTDPNVSFASPQSMFRQRLEFTDNLSNPVVIDPASILKFSVSTETNKVAFRYYPLSPDPAYAYSYTPLEISSPTVDGNGDIYFSLMFNDVNKNEALIITAEDAGGNVYTAKKNAPTGGFANGKYYYGTATLAWLKCKQPTVTGTSATPVYGSFTIPEDPVSLTISGYSEDYYFEISDRHGGTITLDNVTATYDGTFIRHVGGEPNGDISLVLTGTNNISCDSYWGINVYGNLKLSCTGASATLTVTTTLDWPCGISSANYSNGVSPTDPAYNNYATTTELDVTAQLAAPGFTVTRSARTDNVDGTYTWTYTVVAPPTYPVALNAVTSSYVGSVMTTDGYVYATVSDATAASKTAVAMICYVGSENGEIAPYNHGLALALSDANGGSNCAWTTSSGSTVHGQTYSTSSFTSESGLQYNDATHNSDTYPAFKYAIANNGTVAPTGCSAWFLASGYQWDQMISAAGSYNALRDGFYGVGGTNMQGVNYWTSSEESGYYAWTYYFFSGSGGGKWAKNSKVDGYYVRSALAF